MMVETTRLTEYEYYIMIFIAIGEHIQAEFNIIDPLVQGLGYANQPRVS